MSETVSIYKLGIYGKAYDVPGTRRAYTYQYQPDNQGAWRIGEAMTMASLTGGGDYIDTGLGLLKQLERKGYGVYELDESKAQGIPEGLFCTCGLRRSANPHPDAGKPGRYLEVGTQHECIPCTVKSRHEWAQRATKAESQLHELAKHGEQQVKVLEAKNQHQLEEINILNGQLDKFRSQSHGIPALAEIERLRAALHSCAKASSAAKVCLIVDEALAVSQAQQALSPENQRVVPAEPLLAPRHPFDLLAADHKGMRVDYSGLLKQAVSALRRGVKEPGLAELLRQLQEHMTELGRRWYSGDTAVVDELLQLYAVEDAARDALKKAQGGDK